MNPTSLLDLTHIFKYRFETVSGVEFYFLCLREHISSIIHEFEFIDAQRPPLFPNTPPLKEPNKSDEGIGDMYKAVSLSPIIALVSQKKYKMIPIWSSSYSKKNIFTLLTKLKSFMPQLRTIRTVFVDELKWFMAVRKH
ncbi:hypothetical protein LXL04_020380 [Taraxacum kok-saghyz]